MKDLTGRSSAVPRSSVPEDNYSFGECTVEETSSFEASEGAPIVRCVRMVTKDISEVSKEKPMPTSEEYSLEGLLASSAPLTPVACEHLLDSDDLLDLKNQGVTGSLYSVLDKYRQQRDAESQNVEIKTPEAAAAAEINNETKTE